MKSKRKSLRKLGQQEFEAITGAVNTLYDQWPGSMRQLGDRLDRSDSSMRLYRTKPPRGYALAEFIAVAVEDGLDDLVFVFFETLVKDLPSLERGFAVYQQKLGKSIAISPGASHNQKLSEPVERVIELLRAWDKTAAQNSRSRSWLNASAAELEAALDFAKEATLNAPVVEIKPKPEPNIQRSRKAKSSAANH